MPFASAAMESKIPVIPETSVHFILADPVTITPDFG
jgi:hypothetical protein